MRRELLQWNEAVADHGSFCWRLGNYINLCERQKGHYRNDILVYFVSWSLWNGNNNGKVHKIGEEGLVFPSNPDFHRRNDL